MHRAVAQGIKIQVGNFTQRGNEQITPSEGRENCMKYQKFIPRRQNKAWLRVSKRTALKK